MNPEQAKTVAAAMAALWQGEFAATLRVLSAVPDAKRDYSPDGKTRTAWQLVTHIAIADLWFIDCITKGQFTFDSDEAKKTENAFGTVADVVAFHEQTFSRKLAALRDLPGEALAETVDFFGIIQMPRAQWIGYAMNHCVHHRGQLSTYLRAMGSKVPDIYGPSGDAEPVPVAN